MWMIRMIEKRKIIRSWIWMMKKKILLMIMIVIAGVISFMVSLSLSRARVIPPGSLTRRQTNSEVFATPPICDVVVDDYDDDNDGCGRLWPNRLWPSLFDGLCPIRLGPKKSDRLWPTSTDRLWPKLEWLALAKPTVARITF